MPDLDEAPGLFSTDIATNRVRLVYRGGIADGGAVVLDEYANSLTGWRRIFDLLSAVWLHSHPSLARLPLPEMLRIEVVEEKRGSKEVIIEFIFLAAAAGVLGNRADGALVWTFQSLVAWLKRSIDQHIATKRQTTNVEALADALQRLADENQVRLGDTGEQDTQDRLVDTTAPAEDDESDDVSYWREEVSRARALVERLDEALIEATAPLDKSCTSIEVINERDGTQVTVTIEDRGVITEPLSLPPPNREWQEADVLFVRIHKRTGRALFYYAADPAGDRATRFSQIIDSSVSLPDNEYAQSFAHGRPLHVWLRQRSPLPGRLRAYWEITAEPPEPLFRQRRK